MSDVTTKLKLGVGVGVIVSVGIRVDVAVGISVNVAEGTSVLVEVAAYSGAAVGVTQAAKRQHSTRRIIHCFIIHPHAKSAREISSLDQFRASHEVPPSVVR